MATSDDVVTVYVEWAGKDGLPEKYQHIPFDVYDDKPTYLDGVAEYLTDKTGFLVSDWSVYSLSGKMP